VKLLTAHKMSEQGFFVQCFGDQACNILAAAWNIGFCVAAAVELACKLAGQSNNYDDGLFWHWEPSKIKIVLSDHKPLR